MSFLLKGIVFSKGFLYKRKSDMPVGYRDLMLSEIMDMSLNEISTMTLFDLCYVAI